MQFKKLIFVLAIAFTIIFGLLFGSTYAYYVSNNGTNVNVTTGNFDSGVAVIFSQSEYINTNVGIPILESDVETKASKNIFTLVPDANILNGYEVAININLIDIKIANELKISDFKYRLDCTVNSITTTVDSGTGEDIGDNTSILLGTISTNDIFDLNNNTTCTLYVWLNESNANQNDLMNKSFSGLIKVDSVFRK